MHGRGIQSTAGRIREVGRPRHSRSPHRVPGRARRARWEESTAQLNFTNSSRKSWSLLRRLGASQCPPRSSRPPVSPNAVAAHLIQVAKAPADKTFGKRTRDSWRQQCRNRMSDAEPDPISEADIDVALNRVKLGMAQHQDMTTFIRSI